MDFPFMKEALAALFKKSSCDMYPIKPSEAAPNYRGRIVFHADKCSNCMFCERVCSGNAITHEIEETEAGERVTRSFNLGSCTFCATCMDFCSHGAIEFTTDYHMIATKEEDLIVSGSFLKKAPERKAKPAESAQKPAARTVQGRADGKPVQDPKTCVYCTICAKKCPVGALEVDRAEKSWKLDEEACVACGNCESVCPKSSIVCGVKAASASAETEKKATPPKAEPEKTKPEKSEAKASVEPRLDGRPVQDASRCVYCTICARQCPVGALAVDREGKRWVLDEDLCIGCGNCASICPKQCIVV